MRNITRRILAGVLLFFFLNTSCGVLSGPPASRTQTSPQGGAQLPAATATSTGLSMAPLIPITGENVVSMQCQFCVGTETHAVLIFPDFAYFDVEGPSQGGSELFPQIRPIVQSELSWTDARWIEEADRYLTKWKWFYGVPVL